MSSTVRLEKSNPTSEEREFGRDCGLIHEAVVTGRKVGAGRLFWGALAHDEKLFRAVVSLVTVTERAERLWKKNDFQEGLQMIEKRKQEWERIGDNFRLTLKGERIGREMIDEINRIDQAVEGVFGESAPEDVRLALDELKRAGEELHRHNLNLDIVEYFESLILKVVEAANKLLKATYQLAGQPTLPEGARQS